MTKVALRRLSFLYGITSAALLVPCGTALAQQVPIRQIPQGALRASTLRSAAQAPEVTPPITVAVQPRPDTIVLKAGGTNSVMQTLHVTRQHPVASLRANPVITMANARVDLSPVLANPESLPNIANRLRTQPSLAEGVTDDMQVFEVDQGLIVREFLSYRPKSGACSDPGRRALLTRVGTPCFTRMTDQGRAAAFANPNDPHFVADPGKRAQALAAASSEASKEQAEIAGHIAVLRAALNDPAQRAQVEAKVGAAESARLESLNNEQLEEEMANTALVEVEQVMFVPAKAPPGRAQTAMAPNLGRLRPNPPERIDAHQQLKPHVYLTGFTFGRGYEWRHRKSVTVDWCLIDCSSTYYVEAYAGFGYGLGLRFPIRLSGQYNYHKDAGGEKASVTPVFEPINGNEADYSATGIPGDQIFHGKEIVAELQAYAGFGFKVPGWTDSVSANAGKDLTEGLPAPFTNGQFKPPAPGPGNALNKDIVFSDPDLLGGLANYGIAGAKLLPAVKVSLTSNKLSFKLKDNISGGETEMANSGQTYPLAVKPDDHTSNFAIGNPVYNLSFDLTPGIAARLFVNVGVWSHDWDWPVWFPQISIKLPPDGVTFTCHASTICSRSYNYSATVATEAVASTQEAALPEDPVERQVELWRRDFLSKWLVECPNEPVKWCEVAIKSIATTNGNIMVDEIHAKPMSLVQILNKRVAEAEHKALEVIGESKVRNIKEYGEDLIKLYEPAWGKDCADQLCRDNIHKLALQFVQALIARQKAKPLAGRSEIHAEVNAATNWSAKAKQEVDQSKVRAAMPMLRNLRVAPSGTEPVRNQPPGTRVRTPPRGQ